MIKAHFFQTEIGCCGLAWSDRGVYATMLPCQDEAELPVALQKLCPTPLVVVDRPPTAIRRIIERMQHHLAGQPDALTDVPLDLTGYPPFSKSVAARLRKIGPGCTITYSDLARQVGRPRAARAVGQAMARNRLPLLIPCHRVLAQCGLGGFSADGGQRTKRQLLALEGLHSPRPRAGVGRIFHPTSR
jgi:methylated-DNA-[protein]-cysteine S-methyltransferase